MIRSSASDLLLGAGLAYLLSVPLVLLGAWILHAAHWPHAIYWIIAIGINAPHYGATVVRVYQHREERRKYAFFAVWATLLLLVLFIAGLRNALLASLLVTAYVTWSPWHFAGQNYGVALMFLRRSGVSVELRAKRLLYASFLLSFVLAFVALHAAGSSSSYAPTDVSMGDFANLLRLGIPRGAAQGLLLVCGVAYLGCVVAALALLRREASPRQILPVVSLIVCQALWFAVPAALDLTREWSVRPLAFAAISISAAHSLQYLWVTYRYANQTDGTRLRSYLFQTALVGSAVIVLPGLLGAPELFGKVSWNGGVAILTFSIVNLHHFILDGAVWKLRDGRVARALLFAGPEEASATPAARWPAWTRAAVWALCLACLAVNAGDLVWRGAESHRAYALAGATLDRLALLGRDNELARIRLGRRLYDQGEHRLARHQFERSLAIQPTANAYGGLGRTYEVEGQLEPAVAAYEAGLSIDPGNAGLLRRDGFLELRLGHAERAIEFLKRSLEIEPGHPKTREALDRARRLRDG